MFSCTPIPGVSSNLDFGLGSARSHYRRASSSGWWVLHVPRTRPHDEGVADEHGAGADIQAHGARRTAHVFPLAVCAICLLIAFPVLWLTADFAAPVSGMYYVHRGWNLLSANFATVWADERHCAGIYQQRADATAGDPYFPAVTVSSVHAVALPGPIARTWFGTIYVFRCVPYISWCCRCTLFCKAGTSTTLRRLLLPHIACISVFFRG